MICSLQRLILLFLSLPVFRSLKAIIILAPGLFFIAEQLIDIFAIKYLLQTAPTITFSTSFLLQLSIFWKDLADCWSHWSRGTIEKRHLVPNKILSDLQTPNSPYFKPGSYDLMDRR